MSALITRAPRGAPALALHGGRSLASGPERVARDWTRIALQYTPLLAIALLAKISVPPLGRIGLGIDLPILLGAMLTGLLLGRFRVHPVRVLLYLLMLGWLGGAQLMHGDAFSAASIVFLAALFVPLTLQLRAPADARLAPEPDAALHVMAGLASFFALCGLLQYALQGALGARLAFPVEHLLPPSLLIQKFNSLIPLREGVAAFKPNGVFFLEPSFFSQFMALGLLLELSLRKRLTRIALLAAALVVSQSGTGVIVAAVGIASLMVFKRRWDLLLLGAVVALAGVMLADVLQLERLLGRTAEFQSTRSSASARFVAWLDLFNHSSA